MRQLTDGEVCSLRRHVIEPSMSTLVTQQHVLCSRASDTSQATLQSQQSDSAQWLLSLTLKLRKYPSLHETIVQCTFGEDVSQDYNPFKKLFLSTDWTKVRICLSQNWTILRTKFEFLKMHCNTLMHHKMHLTDISQSMIWPNIVYYTKLKLSRIYNILCILR